LSLTDMSDLETMVCPLTKFVYLTDSLSCRHKKYDRSKTKRLVPTRK
jgi:hypothetical protein